MVELTNFKTVNHKFSIYVTAVGEEGDILRARLAMAAVRTLLVDSSRPCFTLNFHCGTQLSSIAKTAAR